MKRFVCVLMCVMMIGLLSCPGMADSAGVYCVDLDSVKAYVWEKTNNLDKEIAFTYPESLGALLAGDGLATLLRCGGIQNYKYYVTDDQYSVEVCDAVYSEGVTAARLWKAGRTSELTETQTALLSRAQSIVDQVMSRGWQDELDLEKGLHDALCAITTYELNPQPDDDEQKLIHDTAVGPLLYGVGECDAYSDAFYLLATLAGFDAGFMSGEAYGEPHSWNTIKLDGGWYAVDVTWDDCANPDAEDWAIYRYMNMGAEAMTDRYIWDENVNIYSVQPCMNWPYFIYDSKRYGAYLGSMEDLAAYIAGELKNGVREFRVMVDGDHSVQEFYDALKDSGLMTFSWSAVTYDLHLTGYTCYDARFEIS